MSRRWACQLPDADKLSQCVRRGSHSAYADDPLRNNSAVGVCGVQIIGTPLGDWQGRQELPRFKLFDTRCANESTSREFGTFGHRVTLGDVSVTTKAQKRSAFSVEKKAQA